MGHSGRIPAHSRLLPTPTADPLQPRRLDCDGSPAGGVHRSAAPRR